MAEGERKWKEAEEQAEIARVKRAWKPVASCPGGKRALVPLGEDGVLLITPAGKESHEQPEGEAVAAASLSGERFAVALAGRARTRSGVAAATIAEAGTWRWLSEGMGFTKPVRMASDSIGRAAALGGEGEAALVSGTGDMVSSAATALLEGDAGSGQAVLAGGGGEQIHLVANGQVVPLIEGDGPGEALLGGEGACSGGVSGSGSLAVGVRGRGVATRGWLVALEGLGAEGSVEVAGAPGEKVVAAFEEPGEGQGAVRIAVVSAERGFVQGQRVVRVAGRGLAGIAALAKGRVVVAREEGQVVMARIPELERSESVLEAVGAEVASPASVPARAIAAGPGGREERQVDQEGASAGLLARWGRAEEVEQAARDGRAKVLGRFPGLVAELARQGRKGGEALAALGEGAVDVGVDAVVELVRLGVEGGEGVREAGRGVRERAVRRAMEGVESGDAGRAREAAEMADGWRPREYLLHVLLDSWKGVPEPALEVAAGELDEMGAERLLDYAARWLERTRGRGGSREEAVVGLASAVLDARLGALAATGRTRAAERLRRAASAAVRGPESAARLAGSSSHLALGKRLPSGSRHGSAAQSYSIELLLP